MNSEKNSNPTNFNDLNAAEKWTQGANKTVPSRIHFFEGFVQQIKDCYSSPAKVLELGSGAGMLAEEILTSCNIESYTLLDFSEAMNELAGKRLSPFSDQTSFIQGDFKSPTWAKDLGEYDVVVTLQAVHEMRDKKYALPFFQQLYPHVRKDGHFFFCDFYYDLNYLGKNPEVYMAKDEQKQTLEQAHFQEVELVLDQEGMALYRSRKL